MDATELRVIRLQLFLPVRGGSEEKKGKKAHDSFQGLVNSNVTEPQSPLHSVEDGSGLVRRLRLGGCREQRKRLNRRAEIS